MRIFISKVIIIIIIGYASLSKLNSQNNSLYNVKDFGAHGDGQSLETEALQNAIDMSHYNGGGIVFFPPGKYLTGTLILKSNVEIYLSNGTIILGSENINDYKSIKTEFKNYNNVFLRYSLFYAEKAENISIKGNGIIDGQGSYFKVTTKVKPDRYKNRPFVIRFIECKNIKIENVRMLNSAMWMQQYLACENLFIKGIYVFNHANQNNDMIDIDGCKNVIITDCIGDSDDDGITLKSTSNIITENVVISNCVVSSHCNAIKIGTESSGGFRNIIISNIIVKPSQDSTPIFGYRQGISGITLAVVDGGILDGVTLSNINIDGTQVPIFFRLGNRARKYFDEQPEPTVGIFKNVIVSNIIAKNIQSSIGCSFTGISKNYIQNIYLNNISLEFPGGVLDNFITKKEVPELEKNYPESTMWGLLPSYGFFIRHVENIKLNNIEIKLVNKDIRPAIFCDDVKSININSFFIKTLYKNENIISFNNVNLGIIQSSEINAKASTFLNVSGDGSNNIFVLNNTFSGIVNLVKNESKNKIYIKGNIIK